MLVRMWTGGDVRDEGRGGGGVVRGTRGELSNFSGALGDSRGNVRGAGVDGGGSPGVLSVLDGLHVGRLLASVFIWTWSSIVHRDPAVAILELPLWELKWCCEGGRVATYALAVGDGGNEGRGCGCGELVVRA